ncbi:MAG: GNAT family N-acetyltransferase [Melioribacteraceae bacterium]|jgi:ribosomal-protein-alanine N-acetyltransferase|nr:GNAT family N-acetyltransferase [Melioribacteraceae bacterium]
MNTMNFSPFPELATNRYSLRRLNKYDAEKILEIRSDKSIGKYLDRPIAKSVDEALLFVKKINTGISKNDLVYWGICKKNNSEIIGTITLWQISKDGTKAEIGFELVPKFQGIGVMQEVVTEIVRFGFEEMKLSIIEGEVDPNNIKSIKLMKSFGFALDRCLEKTEIYVLKNSL